MDGRMLHKLTMDDLAHLHVSSCLHVASIRRGIQLMREQKWNPNCFIQRAPTDGTPGETKDNVRLWSCSRVMDWLRLLDLSEYAPNLRGTGVHGALMVFEVKFTAELLAELLSIPPSKTLLRRHLATHFKELLGREIIQVKRDAENTLGFQPLTLAAKIKVSHTQIHPKDPSLTSKSSPQTPKKSQFSLKRKKSSKGLTGDEWSDYVCPMGDSGQDHLPPHLQTQHNSSQSPSSTSNKSAVVSATTNNTASNAATTTNATNVTAARDNGAQLVASSCTSSSSSSSAANNNAQQHPSFAANPNHVTSNNAALAVSCNTTFLTELF